MGEADQHRRLWVQVVRVPASGVDLFGRYESVVLPLLPDHGGRLESRFVNEDGTIEVHVVSFPSAAALQSYLADERRIAVLELVHESGATAELIPVRSLTTSP